MFSLADSNFYYLSFFMNTDPGCCSGEADDTLAAPPSDEDISISICVKAVKSVLQQAKCGSQPVSVIMYDLKSQYRLVNGVINHSPCLSSCMISSLSIG